jgi:hypothetical protein
MEAIHSSETLAHTRTTRRHIPGDGDLLTHIFIKNQTVIYKEWIREERMTKRKANTLKTQQVLQKNKRQRRRETNKQTNNLILA